jgi:K+-sensing histidine kinase KdpD
MRVARLWERRAVRYLFAVVAVACALGLRLLLIPFTGTGAPFVLFFAAILGTSIFAGLGPGICSLLISIPIAFYVFVVGARYPLSQAAVQTLLFILDGAIILYLTAMVTRAPTGSCNAQTRNSPGRQRAPGT